MPLSAGHDLDARFAVFLNPIKDLTKNWEVDISKYLEEYLEELAEIRISFDGGETVMNFAEAAMLIQGSASVYSKKVDFLWQMVLQMLDLLSASRNFNSSEVESNSEQPANKANKASPNATLDFDKVNISHGRHIDMREEEADNCDNIGFKILPQIPLHLIDKEGEKTTLRIALCLKNFEIFGNKEDYRINRSYLTAFGLLCLDLPQELLNMREQNIVDFANTSIAGFHTEESAMDVMQPDYKSKPPEPEPNLAAFEELDLMPPDMDDFELIPDGMKEVTDCDTSNREAHSATNQAREEIISTKELSETRSSTRKGAAQAKKVELVDPWKPMDPHGETPSRRPIRAGRLRKPLQCSCHTATPKKSKRRKIEADEIKKGKTLPSVDSFIAMELANLVTNNSKASNEMLKSCLMEEMAAEDLKRAELKKGKKIKKLAEVDDDAQVVVPEPDGGGGFDVNDSVHDDIDMPDPHEDFEMPDPSMRPVDPPKALNDTLFYEPASDYEALVQKWVSDYVSSAQEHITSTDLTKRVNKWRKKISPIIDNEEKRASFDIHKYGSHVLTFFPEGSTSDTCLFEDIVRNEDQKEVSRIFLSCLMLANTYNIEPSESREGPLVMDCMQLKILSRERHHKQLEAYAAPSQATQSPKRRKISKRKPVSESSSSDEEICRKDYKKSRRNPR